jgi:hypothetical protein
MILYKMARYEDPEGLIKTKEKYNKFVTNNDC